ncbi:MAG: glutaminyl-peptide cyclotransferase [Verrucomicrobiota bacterium]
MRAARFVALVLQLSGPFLLVACGEKNHDSRRVDEVREAREPRRLAYDIVEITPHDTAASTQGLLFHEGFYYESTGGYGTSTLRRVDPESGKVLKRRELPATAFGEGLALRGDLLYQLEWKGGAGFIYDRETFDRTGEFRYYGEGWGLAWDGKHFILSDGTPFLRFFEPGSFSEVRSVKVRNHLGPVPRLNELELVEGKIFANRWGLDEIVVIDPATGVVEAILNLAALERPRPDDRDAVLNGIAYDPTTRLLHVTGKRWPRVYVLRIRE